MFTDLLIYILVLPLLGILLILFFSITNCKLLKLISLNFSLLPFLGSLFIWAYFEKAMERFQFITFFLLLIPICILYSWNNVLNDLKSYLIALLFLEFFLICIFCILDPLLFYLFFESVTFFGGITIILSGFYSFWLVNRIIFGNMKVQYDIIGFLPKFYFKFNSLYYLLIFKNDLCIRI